MDNFQAEANIKTIREIMERSTRYTNFSGFSGIIAGLLALCGCGVSLWIAGDQKWGNDPITYMVIWGIVFIAAVTQDFLFASRKAKNNGDKLLNPASIMVIKSVLPGIALALALSIKGIVTKDWNTIPVYWTLCYGVADYAAGAFSVPEVRTFGLAQLITGIIGLFVVTNWTSCMFLIALSFGLYHILFGIFILRKYGR